VKSLFSIIPKMTTNAWKSSKDNLHLWYACRHFHFSSLIMRFALSWLHMKDSGYNFFKRVLVLDTSVPMKCHYNMIMSLGHLCVIAIKNEFFIQRVCYILLSLITFHVKIRRHILQVTMDTWQQTYIICHMINGYFKLHVIMMFCMI